MEKEEILNNFTFFYKSLKMIIIGKKNKEITKQEIANTTEDSIENINFRNLLKYLEENKFISVDRERTPYLYRIDYKKLASLLRESKFFEEFGWIIIITKPFDYNF